MSQQRVSFSPAHPEIMVSTLVWRVLTVHSFNKSISNSIKTNISVRMVRDKPCLQLVAVGSLKPTRDFIVVMVFTIMKFNALPGKSRAL